MQDGDYGAATYCYPPLMSEVSVTVPPPGALPPAGSMQPTPVVVANQPYREAMEALRKPALVTGAGAGHMPAERAPQFLIATGYGVASL